MKGMFFLGDHTFELRDLQLDSLGAHDLLIRNGVCGICGTDVHIYLGHEGSAAVRPPVVLGHEYAGIVERVGCAASGFQPGDMVTVDPNMYCGECRYCRAGKKNMCTHMQAIGVTRNGGFAQYSVVPEAQAFRLDPSVSLEHAAMAEPLACCLRGIDQAGIRPGDHVLVIGGGTIGLLMVQLAKLSGAACVILSEPVETRQNIALKLGADAAFNPLLEDPAAQVRHLLGGDGADIVIECVGKPVTTQQALICAAKGACIVLFGVPAPTEAAAFPMFDIFKKELTIRGSFVNPDTHQRAVSLINNNRIQLAPLITHRYPLESLEDAIQMQLSEESIKVVITCD